MHMSEQSNEEGEGARETKAKSCGDGVRVNQCEREEERAGRSVVKSESRAAEREAKAKAAEATTTAHVGRCARESGGRRSSRQRGICERNNKLNKRRPEIEGGKTYRRSAEPSCAPDGDHGDGAAETLRGSIVPSN